MTTGDAFQGSSFLRVTGRECAAEGVTQRHPLTGTQTRHGTFPRRREAPDGSRCAAQEATP